MVVFLGSQAEVPYASPSPPSQLIRGTEEVTTLIDGDAFHGCLPFPSMS